MMRKETNTAKSFMAAALITVALIMVYMVMAADVFAVTEWPTFRGNDENNAVGSYETPTEHDLTEPAWVRQFGESAQAMSSWQYAPNVPIIVHGDIVTTSGKKIVRLDADTGETLESADLSGAVNWGYTPLTYARLTDGTEVIFCPLAGGKIEAVKITSDGRFEILWTFKANEKDSDGNFIWGLTPERDKKEGEEVSEDLITPDGTVLVKSAVHQSLCPILYSDGMVYTGFFSGAYDYYDYYIAVAAEDITVGGQSYKAGELVWKYKSKGGFYWNGALCVGDAVIVGAQDGVNNNDVTGVMNDGTADSHILSFNRKTGAVISDVLLEGAGDICSTVVWDKAGTGRIFWSSCCGYIHSAAVDEATGAISDVKSGKLEDEQSLTVNTPVVYKDRVYIGYKPKKGAYGYFAAYDSATLENKFRAELRGYPKGSAVITTAYEDVIEGRPETGYLYAYISYYQEPAGVQVIRFRADASDAQDESQVKVTDLFDANEYEQYGACSMVADDKGQLYYKNDSNALFAIRKGEPVTIGQGKGLKLSASGRKITAKFTKDAGATRYRILYRVNSGAFKDPVIVTTNKGTFTVPNSSVVTVKVRPEHIDAAKKYYGTYSEEAYIYSAESTIKKLTKAKKAFTVKYDKHAKANGYQIQYSLKKSMSGAKTVKVTSASTVSKKIKKLKSKKTYYVRVRSYRKVSGTMYYGKWSTKGKIKVQ